MAINTEDTIFDGAINEQAKSVAKAVAPKKRKPRKPLTFGQQVAIGGTTGVLFGAAATYAAKAYLHHEHEEQPAEEAFVVTENGLKLARVNDDFSFTDAFQEARDVVGPGGAFIWHGNVYGTFTAAEWSALDKAEMDAFNAKISDTHLVDAFDDDLNVVASADGDEPDLMASVEVDDDAADVQIVGLDDDADVVAMGQVVGDAHDVYLVDIDEPAQVQTVDDMQSFMAQTDDASQADDAAIAIDADLA